jgi:hypothetical protein
VGPAAHGEQARATAQRGAAARVRCERAQLQAAGEPEAAQAQARAGEPEAATRWCAGAARGGSARASRRAAGEVLAALEQVARASDGAQAQVELWASVAACKQKKGSCDTRATRA